MELCKGCVVRVVRGRKVPVGTVARVFWFGETRYGTRLGIKVAGSEEALWTAATNVEVIESAPEAAPAAPRQNAEVSLRGLRVVVERGRNVAHGTAGVCFWEGYGQYGKRIGFKCEVTGETCWTAASNVSFNAPATALVVRQPEAPVVHEAEIVEEHPAAAEFVQKKLVAAAPRRAPLWE